jgi:hypothetical protein
VAQQQLYVDCTLEPGGDGSAGAPLSRITDAMAVARGLGGTEQVEIEVAEGVCDQEALPINLDVPLHLKGTNNAGKGTGRPDDVQDVETVVTYLGDVSPPGFFTVLADNVEVSHLRIDGRYAVLGDVQLDEPMTPAGITITGRQGFDIHHLRIDHIAQPVRSEGSSGRIAHNYFEGSRGPFLSGASALNPAVVEVAHNRIVYRINGLAMAGASTQAVGTSLRATVDHNEIETTFTNSGPTTPTALRVSPMLGNATTPAGFVDLVATANTISGAAKYGIMLHAGQPVRTGASYSGQLVAQFTGNTIGPAVLNPALITFTNSRATVLPCELNPASTKATCPLLSGPPNGPFVYSEYLSQASYTFTHSGELNGALIDHPAVHPIDAYSLQNQLLINGSLIPNCTFVVVPPSVSPPACPQ